MSEAHRVSPVHSFLQAAPSTANLATFLRATGPPDLPSLPSTANTISKSVRSKSVPRRWLRKVASKIGLRKEKASDMLFPESPHLSIKEFKDGTSVKMINSPNVPPPSLCRIFDNPRMSASLSWASPANPLGVLPPDSDSPAPPSPNISVFSPRPPSPAPTLRSRRRSATVSAATRRFPSLPRFSIHQEDDEAAAPDLYLVRRTLPISSGTSHASSSTTFSFSKEGSRFRSPTTTTLSSVSPTLTDGRNHTTSTTFNHTPNDGLPTFTIPLPVRSSPQSTTDSQSLAINRVYSLGRKAKSKQRARSSTILTNLLDPLTLGSPIKPKVGKERISPPLDTPYSRERRISFLEDVKVEQDLGWGASVVDMLTAKQGTDHETETKLEANSEPPKVSHEMDDPNGDVCTTDIK